MIARRLAKRLPAGFVARKNVVYRPGFEYCAHGILIERTPYKDTVYIRHLVGIFFLPFSSLDLTYSSRITQNRDAADYLFQGGEQDIADHSLRRLQEIGLLETLPNEIGIADFVAMHRSVPLGPAADIGKVCYLAVAAFLAGDHARSATCLDWCRTWLGKEDRIRDQHGVAYSEFQEMVRTLLPVFERPPNEAARLLRDMIHRNAMKLGFIPATPNSDEGDRLTA